MKNGSERAKVSLELINVSEMHHHSGSQIYAHARKTFGLIYVLSGSAIYEFDGVTYPVKAGDLFCLPQKRPYSMLPVKDNDYCTRQFGLLIYEQALNTRMKTLYPPLTVDPTMKSMLDYIYQFWKVPTQENISLLEVFVRAIFAQFYINELHYDDPVSMYVLTDGYSPATKKTLCYVEANKYKRFSLEETAQALGYNKHYLCTAFSQDTGISILSYVHFQKVRQAMVHFFYWGTSLSEVCESLSFDSISYFSTLFKSIVGYPPGAFRKACLSLDAEDRTRINSNTTLFLSRPLTIEDSFASMRQLAQNIMRVSQSTRLIEELQQ
jgi:AraC-like DNA-binding protein